MIFGQYYYFNGNAELVNPNYEVIDIFGLGQGVVNAQ